MKTATETKPVDRRITAAAQAAAKAKRAPAAASVKHDCAEIERQKLALLAQRYDEKREAGKRAYAESDELLEQILAVAGVGTRLVLPDGRIATVEDNFLDKNGRPRNKAFKPCGVSRFELKIK